MKQLSPNGNRPMSYKSILTYTDDEAGSEGRLATAMELTRRFDAHLTIVAFGYDPDIPPYAFEGSGIELVDFYTRSREQADKLAQTASKMLERQGITGEAIALTSFYSGLARRFGALARFADLVVLSQPSVSDFEQAAVKLLEGALFDGDTAILVCPKDVPRLPGDKILVGWNGDREALRAVRRAMPFLRRAKTVEIAVIDPPGSGGNPGADLAVLLARHGIGVEITTHSRAGKSISEVLLQRAVDLDADLLVMGAYGHSRFREYVLGGATREILEDAQLPVLMAH